MDKAQKIAIDLIWVKPGVSGGVESYIRNLLDGFSELSNKRIQFVLFTANDNYESFSHYSKWFEVVKCNVNASSASKRNIWANLHLGNEIKKRNISVCFEPVYSMPFWGIKGIRFVTTIHDLNQLHFPENCGITERLYTRLAWKNALEKSADIVTVSKFVKDDILHNFRVDEKKIIPILNPIRIDIDDILELKYIEDKYGLKNKEYYYTVSSMLAHKNLETLVKAMKLIVEKEKELPHRLVISGVGGSGKQRLMELINELGIKDNIIITPFIDNRERNTLYKYSYAFVFPSVFEGFGMPPIEAMYFGVPVITTKLTSIPEVTENRAIYVDDPFDENEWCEKMNAPEVSYDGFDIGVYSYQSVAERYIEVLCK